MPDQTIDPTFAEMTHSVTEDSTITAGSMTRKNQSKQVAPISEIESRIFHLRGNRVIIDSDLADLYGIPTKRLNEQVKRNQARFPSDFAFRLNRKELGEVVANCDHLAKLRYSPTTPYAFTEHGAIMAANILNSPQAVLWPL
jgi:hypothetical protein